MSHYAVAVFTTLDDKNVEELLAPYNESLHVPHYISKQDNDWEITIVDCHI